jgi:glycosyltransferase involved in cell wall biosynthesis
MKDRIAETRFAPNVLCIPNGIDLARFTPDGTSSGLGDELVIGCASRLIEGKGIEDAIAALARPSLARAVLRIAGTGPLEAPLRELARSVDVEGRVEFSGRVLDMPAFWRSVDVAVVPSNQWIESFGMVALEAMACARPVVVTRNGALTSLVKDGQTGIVVPPADVDALAGALAAYGRDTALRDRHGWAGRRRCEEQFSIERTALRYLELCAELIAKPALGEPRVEVLEER